MFPKWSLPFCVTSAEGCATQELVGPMLTGTHTLGWFPEAARRVELWSVLLREHCSIRQNTPSLHPSQDGWELGESCKKGAGKEPQPAWLCALKGCWGLARALSRTLPTALGHRHSDSLFAQSGLETCLRPHSQGAQLSGTPIYMASLNLGDHPVLEVGRQSDL